MTGRGEHLQLHVGLCRTTGVLIGFHGSIFSLNWLLVPCWSAAEVCPLLNQYFIISEWSVCSPPQLTYSLFSTAFWSLCLSHIRPLSAGLACLLCSICSGVTPQWPWWLLTLHSQQQPSTYTTGIMTEYLDTRACCPRAKEGGRLPSQNLPRPTHTMHHFILFVVVLSWVWLSYKVVSS